MQPLGDLVDRWLKKNRVRERVDTASLFGRWRDVVGEELSRKTRIVDVRGGELIVEVSSSTLLNELSTYGREDIMESLREIDEFRGVKTVRFRVGTT